MVLGHEQDFRTTGKRHPYLVRYEVGFTSEGRITALKVLIEAPDDVVTAGLLVKVATTVASTNVSTTKLLTVGEALDALRRGGGVEYRAPGAPGS